MDHLICRHPNGRSEASGRENPLAFAIGRHALGVVRFGDVMGRVDDATIAALKAIDELPPSEPLPLTVGAIVRVAEGLLAGRQGQVTHLKANTAHLSLEGWRHSVVVAPMSLEMA